jgi:hypothetical protein
MNNPSTAEQAAKQQAAAQQAAAQQAAAPATALVPVTSPAHPAHNAWLQTLLIILEAVTAIGPAVVAVADPKDAALANSIGGIAAAAEGAIPTA